MKNIVLFITAVFISLVSIGQQAKWDSTYRPGNYEQRVANFRSYPDSKKDIIFLGNSITDYAEWNELLQLPEARNRGISGDITFGVLERLDEVTEGKPAKIFILIGINDIARNIPDSVILDNYKKIINPIENDTVFMAGNLNGEYGITETSYGFGAGKYTENEENNILKPDKDPDLCFLNSSYKPG